MKKLILSSLSTLILSTLTIIAVSTLIAYGRNHYQVQPICVGGIRYYTVGNLIEGVKAMSVAIDQNGNPMTCKF